MASESRTAPTLEPPYTFLLQTENRSHTGKLPANTIVNVDRLAQDTKALLSDLSILHGQFLKDDDKADNPSKKAIVEAGYSSCQCLLSFEVRIERLKDEVIKRGAGQLNVDSEDGSDRIKQISKERETLAELQGIYITMRNEITSLRIQLEEANRGTSQIYDYELDIQYQVLGNQTLPRGYIKTKRDRRNGSKRSSAQRLQPQPPSNSPPAGQEHLQSITQSDIGEAPPRKKLKLKNTFPKGGPGSLSHPLSRLPSNLQQVGELNCDISALERKKNELASDVRNLKMEKIGLGAQVQALREKLLDMEQNYGAH